MRGQPKAESKICEAILYEPSKSTDRFGLERDVCLNFEEKVSSFELKSSLSEVGSFSFKL